MFEQETRAMREGWDAADLGVSSRANPKNSTVPRHWTGRGAMLITPPGQSCMRSGTWAGVSARNTGPAPNLRALEGEPPSQ